MACGDRYRNLAVTSNGYTFDNPFGAVGIYPYDYVQWQKLAEKLVDLATVHYHVLGDYEAEISGGTHHPKWNDLLPLQHAMVADYQELPSSSIFMSGSDGEAGISEAQNVISQALCLLEQSDDALAAYHEVPPPIPGVVPKARPDRNDEGTPWWVWSLVGAGVVVVASAVIMHRRRTRQEPPKAKPTPRKSESQAIAHRPASADDDFGARLARSALSSQGR